MISINTGVVKGIEGFKVNVEVNIENGIPHFVIIGLGDTMVKESSERIKSAIINSGFRFPKGRIVVNLSPANIKKKGSHLELAVAVGILIASGQVKCNENLENIGFFGELSLNGNVLEARGILPMSQALEMENINTFILPKGNFTEKDLIKNKTILVQNLKDVIEYLNTGNIPELNINTEQELSKKYNCIKEKPKTLNFSQVRGHAEAKRAITIAAAGNHGLIMVGSPGSGKTMLAKRIPTILPPMNNKELIETATIYSILGKLDIPPSDMSERPFRAPYYKSTSVSLIGGGQVPMPGEISLAHNGVLFLDEIGEFSRNVLDSLRTPMEEKKITICRKGENYTFPADFMLVGASNPCKCGFYGDPNRECTCSQYDVDNYRKKISGPLAHRIDLHIYIPNIDFDTYDNFDTVTSEEMREIVIKTRKIQSERYENINIEYNSQLSGDEINKYCILDEEARTLLRTAYDTLQLTPRTCEKTIKIARTIADIDGEKNINQKSMAEALSYRGNDKIYGNSI